MNPDTDKLIASLSSGLQPVRTPPRAEIIALLWLVASAGFVIGITHWLGPIRSNALTQLATEPRFLLETLLGVAAISFMAIMAFRTAVPGAASGRGLCLGAALMVLWLANYLVNLAYPALEPSMLGKRDHCVFETMIFALPPAVLALLLSRRLYPLKPVQSASLFCLTAGMMPALYMQIACMYMPLHILQMHILPGLLVMVAGAVCAWAATRIRERATD